MDSLLFSVFLSKMPLINKIYFFRQHLIVISNLWVHIPIWGGTRTLKTKFSLHFVQNNVPQYEEEKPNKGNNH